ncbi:manganese-dependent inorganic pyrophosphatase [bacterium]|jgi:manganese-dependent inorganic pyrophosphatase|nr:manganese-dependent inorganic pyrophosphatase [bacterium]MBT4251498.1 manganese-dependent inorganic pyrophosphatase [bacterium]MBT4597472.1 manganese-dependent inorganic pyrophosphatase [bacterium]MBT6754311.1 manganese-dependent inorganic pyrophosphatase [bacterium]MBT7037637.1 manganese-dependent inorganic pyrophosphatase [bacterium]
MKYIIGHKNPDTDTICSAIGYQAFLEARNIKSEALALGSINKETKFVLTYFGVDLPREVSELPHNSEIILVDHNEESQSIDNLNELDIIEIIDHHKVKIQTDKPIRIHVEPLGSSCSIIAKKYFAKNLEISKEVAGLLLAGIISDTLYFRSPTTTETDKELVKKLNEIVEIEDLAEFSMLMFYAKSDMSDIKTKDLIKLDYKVFEFGGAEYGIGVMETTNKDAGLERKEEILENLTQVKKTDNLKGAFLSIIDILNKESYTLCSGNEEKELFIEMFKAEDREDVLFVDGIVSRKKEIVPVFENHLNK